jgi:putative toxin-antitoxin system antitoxin component (TIGR02293 family)
MLTTEQRAEVQRLIAEAFWSAKLVDPLVEVTARAIEVFGSREKALRWLKTPIRSLGDQSPLSLLDTPEGIDRVNDVLGRVEHGVW